MDVHDLHHVAAARPRVAEATNPASTESMQASPRPRASAGRGDQLWVARAKRNVHHRDGAFHPGVFPVPMIPASTRSRCTCWGRRWPMVAGTAGALRGATHASMHTTISVLEGLRLLELHRTRDVRRLARCATPRSRVPVGSPPLPVSPDREHHQVRFHAFCVPATLALRHSASARLLSSCRRATRSPPCGGDRHRDDAPARRRSLVSAILV